MLKERTLTTLVTLPLLIAAVWFDSQIHSFTVLIALWGVLAVSEFYGMVVSAKVPPLTLFGIVWTLLFILSGDGAISSFLETRFGAGQVPVFLLISAAILPLTWLLRNAQNREAVNRWTWTLAGIVYIGVLLSLLLAVRGASDGRNWVFFIFLTTIASDSAAFLIGRKWGRRKLAPAISPAKTWEGAIAGVFGAIIISLVFVPAAFGSVSNPLFLPVLSYLSAMSLALAASIFGQLGDLVESLIKRNMNAKDSGRVFPGHGGALDRLDSVVFAGVVVYYYVVWLTR